MLIQNKEDLYWRTANIFPAGLDKRTYLSGEVCMRFKKFSFGFIRIEGVRYEHVWVLDRWDVRKRKKKPSKKFRDEFGHTPVSIEETIPWRCRRPVIGTGTGAMPVMDDVKSEARRRKIALLVLPTAEAIEELKEHPEETN